MNTKTDLLGTFERFRVPNEPTRLGDEPSAQLPPPAIQNRYKRMKGGFLKGPIPLCWLTAASKLPGKAFTIGIVLWYLVGLKKTNQVRLTNATLVQFGMNRKTKYKALSALEKKGLIQITRNDRRNPTVTVNLN